MIPAISDWPTNGDLIADVAKLYLQEAQLVLDATYGRGKWWTRYRPTQLVKNDISPYSYAHHHFDFRDLPWLSGHFDAVAFDPPYKLNGTPVLGDFDDRYGIQQYSRWQDRIQLILDGFRECARVSRDVVLVKCQDQVVSGKMRWQTFELMKVGEELGLELVDRFDMVGGTRPQPPGRRQLHARGRGSTLLVFR